MTDAVIGALPPQLREEGMLVPLERTSEYGQAPARGRMCASQMRVVHLDKLPRRLNRRLHMPCDPKSADALYIGTDGTWYLIEFKSGQVSRDDVQGKLYDSLIVLLELALIPDFRFSREHVEFILVYNGEEVPADPALPPSRGRDRLFGAVERNAGRPPRPRFGLGRFRGYLVRDVHTYDEAQFQSAFVRPFEQAEARQGGKAKPLSAVSTV